jgi:coproporphyrinogen III oxidase-like Fe-S oxidoreductase
MSGPRRPTLHRNLLCKPNDSELLITDLPSDGHSVGATLQRNVVGYTTHAHCDLIGLGMSAINHMGIASAQNFRALRVWEAAIDSDDLPLW